MSRTPVSYRHHPPMTGEHTDEVLEDWLGEEEDTGETDTDTGDIAAI